MADEGFTLTTFYDSLEAYQDRIKEAIAPLTGSRVMPASSASPANSRYRASGSASHCHASLFDSFLVIRQFLLYVRQGMALNVQFAIYGRIDGRASLRSEWPA
jgi:hypothetical protein